MQHMPHVLTIEDTWELIWSLAMYHLIAGSKVKSNLVWPHPHHKEGVDTQDHHCHTIKMEFTLTRHLLHAECISTNTFAQGQKGIA